MGRLDYFLLLCLFPLFFVLHGINENFGLLTLNSGGTLFLKYILITLFISIVSKLLFKQLEKAFLFCIFLLSFYFFFGIVSETLQGVGLKTYSLILPLISLLVFILFIVLKRHKGLFKKSYRFFATLLILLAGFEIFILLYNVISNKALTQDFGDQLNHVQKTVIKQASPEQRPDVYWIVIDEYASSRVLKERFNINNPLDSVLRRKGFFVADSASSNYNYTQFSLASQLDMVYLKEFSRHSVVTPRDAIRGQFALYENNVIEVFKQFGYRIENLSFYDLKGYPTKGIIPDFFRASSLIDNQTLSGKLAKDIGWQFPLWFKKNKEEAKLALNRQLVVNLDSGYKKQHRMLQLAIRNSAKDSSPVFLMTHLFDAHEPFIYNEDGSLYTADGLHANANTHYIPQLLYSNSILSSLIDSIQLNNKRDYVIILQGDHGFKFDENDSLFDKESCSTLFAVYYKNGEYQSWPNQFTSVNSFRILFNDKFKTQLPLLPDSSNTLYYRSKKQ